VGINAEALDSLVLRIVWNGHQCTASLVTILLYFPEAKPARSRDPPAAERELRVVCLMSCSVCSQCASMRRPDRPIYWPTFTPPNWPGFP